MVNLLHNGLNVLAEAPTPTELWTAISGGMTSLMSIVASIGSEIIGNTLFQVVFTVSIGFVAVRLFKRLIRVR